MEAEGEDEKEMKMVLHCPPIHPLPEEIKKMEHSETVCSYCGISYLIFHEFHQLQTQVAQFKAELQGLREKAKREKAQQEALELSRLEWERAFHLEGRKQVEVKEKSIRRELEERMKDMETALREEFEMNRREMEEEFQKSSQENERHLRRELGDSEAERLRKQRELEGRAEEREKVQSDALQKANKNVDELRKNLQQLEERLALAAATKEEAEQLLGKEKQKVEILRDVCVRQQQALRSTLSVLRSSCTELADVQGLLSQLMGAWQVFCSQMPQQSSQIFSALREELRHSSVELQKVTEQKDHLTQQLKEQKRQREAQLCQLRDSENEHRGKLFRLKGELEEEKESLLSCQHRCNTLQEQLTSLHRREEQTNRKCRTAEEEVTRAGKALEKAQQEMRELRRERHILIQSHEKELKQMEEYYREETALKLASSLEEQRTQNALHLREQAEDLRREVELELTIDREKNQLLHLQLQQDNTQLQLKLEEREKELQKLQDKLQQERRRREEEIHQELQQEASQLSQAKAELQLMTWKNAELQEEVVLLQDTVRRECEEREELTAVLSQAQEELLGLRSLVSHHGSSRCTPDPTERQTTPGNKNFHLYSQARIPLTRSSTSPNTLGPSLGFKGKDRGWSRDGEQTWKSSLSCNSGELLGREKGRELTLPRLMEGAVSNVQRKVNLMMEKRERL
ncbi:trichohyalin [Labrus bergylta]|uniref:trichohyalin n=1 Tax=Labrus bergylta TaxID=56723 RepID=UPI003313F66E